MPHANYLEKKAPQIKGPFIKTLHQIPSLAGLDQSTLEALYGYSRFVNLSAGQTLFQQGSFDQSVYFLISGTIEVFIKNEDSPMQKIDTLTKPFSLVGERSILGEPQEVNISAAEPSLLLGIDMSLLPDMRDYYENQEKLGEDESFSENISLYTVLGHVLAHRVDRLVKDQYKLTQKIDRLNETSKSWKTNELMSLIFNQFVENKLPKELNASLIIKKVLTYYRVQSPRLDQLFQEKLDTSEFYIEIVALKAAGKIIDLEKLLFTIIKQISAYALKGEIYKDQLTHHPHKLLPLVSLSNVLEDIFNELQEADILNNELAIEVFIAKVIDKTQLSPKKMIDFISEHSLVNHKFGIAYLLFLFCKCHLKIEGQVNKRIQERVAILNGLTRSKQDLRLGELDDKMKVAINNLKKMATLVDG